MKARQLEKLGIPRSLSKEAKWTASIARERGLSAEQVKQLLKDIVANPDAHRENEHFSELARKLSISQRIAHATQEDAQLRSEPVPYQQWGDDLEPESVDQMHRACHLPVSVAGALMPDAHLGYGLPIGGVLATENAVIPYAVGVDIACRMKLSIFDMPAKALESQSDRLENAIERETRFGVGAAFGRQGAPLRDHEVLDRDWNVSPVTRQFRDKAVAQLGTSGSGNHFVEFGILTVAEDDTDNELALQPGEYLALLSHSGSRGTGAQVCSNYSNLAMSLHPNLPRDAMHLAWLDMDSHEGQEYWAAMNLMGEYAAANHACIHEHIAKNLGARVIAGVENHHNFAWKETHTIDGEQRNVIVHRKGATPAGAGVLGVIPGSMASPCYVVRGKGVAASLNSAAHGAGRVMSRRKAKENCRWSHVRDLLQSRGVRLISAGIDENPTVYKDIDQVMANQRDLVDIVARFDPKLVKMAPDGERAED